MNILIKSGLGLIGAVTIGFLGEKIYSEHHYDKDGYNAKGFDCDGFDRDGYDYDGFDREGYDCEGFNIKGFDRDGFDKNGFDRFGYDRSGFNDEGFDRRGFNAQRFNCRGFGRDGFNAEGYDLHGFGRNGYDTSGIDRSGRDSDYYKKAIIDMRELAQKALAQMKKGEFAYAFRDIRVDAEKALKAVLQHRGIDLDIISSLNHMIIKCRESKLLPCELCDKLDGLRFQCNDTQHDTHIEKTYDDAHFCYMTLKETIDYLEECTQ